MVSGRVVDEIGCLAIGNPRVSPQCHLKPQEISPLLDGLLKPPSSPNKPLLRPYFRGGGWHWGDTLKILMILAIGNAKLLPPVITEEIFTHDRGNYHPKIWKAKILTTFPKTPPFLQI